MVDLDSIPFADEAAGAGVGTADAAPVGRTGRIRTRIRSTGRPRRPLLAILMVAALGIAHGLAIWWGLGGLEGLTNGWPLWRDDHPLYYHSALVTRSFLRQSGTTAGYDPAFMAGYAKSVVFPASSTLPEVVIWAFGGDRPELAYKLYVLVSAAALPWLVALAAAAWRLRAQGAALAVLVFLLYVWTDFPINYATFGMLPYLLAIPLGLLATGLFGTFLIHGGVLRWLLATGLMSLAVMVHLTAAMVVAPAAALAYLAALSAGGAASPGGRLLNAGRGEEPDGPGRVIPRRFSAMRHLGVWLVPLIVLASNAFWWLPGLWLASTKGASDFAFAHSSEGVFRRLLQIVTVEAEVQSILLAVGLPGLVLLVRQSRIRGTALAGFCLSGLFWGYLAGGLQSLDFLQPGRHTYAFYAALALAGGAGLDAFFLRLRGGGEGASRLDRWAMAATLVIGLRVLGPPLFESVRGRLWAGEPFLSSRPSPRLLWVIDRVKAHVKQGERLLYEEGGKSLPGIPDPFQRGRFSGLLPERTGVELIGGPYLHAALTTNFTQFGEGALFGKSDWDREYFVKYARLYRPAAILCWSPRARRFCRSHPDLITILDDDGAVLIGTVHGFEGDTMVGAARVAAEPGRLQVSEMTPGVDGSVVLRYHSVPSLRARPPIPLEPRFEEGDPVPFIGLRPTPGTREVDLEMVAPF
jgi:hypothetical protein